MRIDSDLRKVISGIAIVGAFLGGTRGCNWAFNNRHVVTPSYEMNSYATGLTGHVEFTRYNDGSRDVKIYPGLSHKLFDSKLYQDLDGDILGTVDRIRENGAEWKFNRLDQLLSREVDLGEYKEEFEEADRKLRELMEKYGRD